MPFFQAAWVMYMNNSALVLNSLALFYALCGGWLIIATQLRAARAVRLLSSPSGVMEEAASAQRGNRLFMRVGGLCLGLALLLSIASALV